MFGNKNKIKKIIARQILDSRGVPTLEVKVRTFGGAVGVAGVPSGASTGKKEAFELRDGGKDFFGKAVTQAAENINTRVNNALAGQSVTSQKKIDELLIWLDGTPNKSGLGGNAITGVSIACAKTAAAAFGVPFYKYVNKISASAKIRSLPKILFNLINGGLHADNGLEVQEFHFIPLTDRISDSVQMGSEVYHQLGKILRDKNLSTSTGDEGGYAPMLERNTICFELIIQAADACGYIQGKDYGLGIDAAANSFVTSDNQNFKYTLEGNEYSMEGIVKMYTSWVDQYKLILIEDGLGEDDKAGWRSLTKILKDQAHVAHQKVEVVGDDLFVSHAQRLIDGAQNNLASAVIIKPNQIGTLTETFQTVSAARKHIYACVASHRSGETCDDAIADIAVGVNCEYIKAGAPAHGERVAKYNRLLEIE